MNIWLLHIIGNIGVLLVLGAYFLISTGRLKSISPRYQLLNLVGAIILTVYAVILVAWASVVLNGIWALIALVALIRNRTKVESPSA